MPKTALRLLSVAAAVPALAGCGMIPLPPVALPDVENISITAPQPNPAQPITDPNPGVVTPEEIGEYSRFFRKDSLFSAPVDSRAKSIRIEGTAKLNQAATTRTVIDVLLVESFDESLCKPVAAAEEYRTCKAPLGSVIGTLVFEKGSTSTNLNLGSSLLTELAHKGQGHIGLELKEGELNVQNSLSFVDMQAKANF